MWEILDVDRSQGSSMASIRTGLYGFKYAAVGDAVQHTFCRYVQAHVAVNSGWPAFDGTIH